MTTENKKPDDKPEEPKELDETALFDAVSEAVDDVTDPDALAAAKEQTPEEKAAAEAETVAAAEAETAAAEAEAAVAAEEQTPEEKATAEAETAAAAAEEQTPEEKATAEAEAAAAEEQTPEEKAAAEAEAAAAEKVDPINDPIPESTNEKTAERIKSLIGLVKGSNESVGQRDEILQQITATGTDADQYANTLGFLKLYNSTDATERKQALEVARGLVKELALELGEGSTVTKLSDYEDLTAEVEAGTLSQARALEIAATREADKLRSAKSEATTTATETANQTQQNLAIGKDQLDKFEIAVRGSDDNYAKIRPQFIKLLGPFLKRTHPTEWGAAAQEVYDQVKSFVPAEKPKPKPKPKNTPLRPKSGAGGGTDKDTEVDDAVGAIDAALANM